MNRLLLLIAILFAMASMSGPTMGAAVATGDLWTVVDHAMCIDTDARAQTERAFRPCAKKINGLAIPCQPPAGVMPSPEQRLAEPPQPSFDFPCHAAIAGMGSSGRFRPPRRV